MAGVSKKQLEKVEKTCDVILNKVANVEKNISVMEKNLAICVNTLLDHIKIDEAVHADFKNVVERQLPPIKRHVDRVHFVIKTVPYVLGIIAVIAGLMLGKTVSLF